MPSVSRNQQIATAIAEHEPGKLYARNRGLLKMSHSQLHDFAATKRTGLPKKVSQRGRLSSHITALRRRGAFRKGGY
jgi:hypothetical protein